jgi:hypothetical protein
MSCTNFLYGDLFKKIGETRLNFMQMWVIRDTYYLIFSVDFKHHIRF